MEHFPASLSCRQSDDLIGKIEAGFDRRGYAERDPQRRHVLCRIAVD